MISCEELIEELNEYLDEECTPEQRRKLESHLKACGDCQVVADTARQTVKIITGCGSFELPSKMSSKIMSKVRGAGPTKKG